MQHTLKHACYLTWRKIRIAVYILLPFITLLSFISTLKYGALTEKTLHSVTAWTEFSRDIAFGLTYMPAIAAAVLCLLSFSPLFTREERDNLFSQPIPDKHLLTAMMGMPLLFSIGLMALMDVEMMILSMCFYEVCPPVFSTALPRYALVVGMVVVTSLACIVGKTWDKVLQVFFGVLLFPGFALLACFLNNTATELVKTMYYICCALAVCAMVVYSIRKFSCLRQETGTSDYVSSNWSPLLFAAVAAVFVSAALVKVLDAEVSDIVPVLQIVSAVIGVGMLSAYLLKHRKDKKGLVLLCGFGASVVLMGGLYVGIIQYAIVSPLENPDFVRSIEWAEADQDHLTSSDSYQPTYRSYCLTNLPDKEDRTDAKKIGSYNPAGTRYLITDKLGIKHDVYIDDADSEWLTDIEYGKYPEANDVIHMMCWVVDGANTYWRDRSLITIKGDYAKVLEYIKENDLFDEATNDSSRLKLGSTGDIYRSATLGSVVPANEGQHIGALCIRVGITVDDQNYQQWYYTDREEFMDFLSANSIAYESNDNVPVAANNH